MPHFRNIHLYFGILIFAICAPVIAGELKLASPNGDIELSVRDGQGIPR